MAVQADTPIGRWGAGGGGLDARTRAFAEAMLGPPEMSPAPMLREVSPSQAPECGWSRIAPEVGIETDDAIRARHSRGMSYLDLLAWRDDDGPLPAVDAVAFPHPITIKHSRWCRAARAKASSSFPSGEEHR